MSKHIGQRPPLASSSPRSDSEMLLLPSSETDDGDGKAVGSLTKEDKALLLKRQRAVSRWLVCFTLVRNPSLVEHTKRNIRWRKAQEEKEKAKLNDDDDNNNNNNNSISSNEQIKRNKRKSTTKEAALSPAAVIEGETQNSDDVVDAFDAPYDLYDVMETRETNA